MRTIEDFSLVNYFLKKIYTNKIVIHEEAEDLKEIFRDNPKLVCALNHGGAPAPMAAFSGVLDTFFKNGGEGRKPIIVAWRTFYKIPLMGRAMRYMTQVDGDLSANDFMEKLNTGGFTDLFVMPEGENCMFSDGEQVVPFLSPKFIEFAVRCKTPVLVIVHSGTESLSTPVEFEEEHLALMKWLPTRHFKLLEASRTIAYPHFGKRDINELKLHFRVYHPQLTEEDLSENSDERYEQLRKESDAVREMMIAMKAQLFNKQSEDVYSKKASTDRPTKKAKKANVTRLH